MSIEFEAEILETIDETEGIKTFILQRSPEFHFNSGQYVWMSLPGTSRAPMAIASGTKDKDLTFTIRRWGEMTTKLFQLQPGDKVRINGPHGSYFPNHFGPETPLLLVAGGTGITPIRSYMRSIYEKKNVTVLYGAQTPNQILYKNEHLTWMGRLVITVDTGDENWKDATGLVTDILRQREIEPNSICFVCGPNGMLKATIELLRSKNIPDNQIYVSLERFDDDGNVIGPVLSVNDPVVGL